MKKHIVRMRLFRLMFLLGISGVYTRGQMESAKTAPIRIAFEVASIKPSASLDMAQLMAESRTTNLSQLGPHVYESRAEYTYMSLKDLIANAYGINPSQVSGPRWLAEERFDIQGKIPDGVSKDKAPQMLQTLLVTRFGLVQHRDFQDRSVLALLIGKGGIKMQPSIETVAPVDGDPSLRPGGMNLEVSGSPTSMPRNSDGSMTIDMGAEGTIRQKIDAQAGTIHIESSRITMPGFADMLTTVLRMGGEGNRQRVVDMTGLKGNYQVTLNASLAGAMKMLRAQGFAPSSPVSTDPATPSNGGSALTPAEPSGGGPTIFASIEKLGLELKEHKAAEEQLVVDHIEKIPTPN